MLFDLAASKLLVYIYYNSFVCYLFILLTSDTGRCRSRKVAPPTGSICEFKPSKDSNIPKKRRGARQWRNINVMEKY